jgi:hypothetical protein
MDTRVNFPQRTLRQEIADPGLDFERIVDSRESVEANFTEQSYARANP